MSDRNKNIISFITDLFRYHRDELSGLERNTFERELQKDPFSEEAAEGFAFPAPDLAVFCSVIFMAFSGLISFFVDSAAG